MFDSLVDDHIARATICRDSDWGLAEEELRGLELIEFLLPSVQQTRSMSRVLALRTRLAIAEGRYDDAIKYLRMNYQLGQNVAKMKFLVAGLVAVAEIGIANEGVIQLIGSQDSPNMYWALAELPHPLIDMREAMRLELASAARLIPELEGVETAEHSDEEWSLILNRAVASFTSISRVVQGSSSTGAEFSTTGLALLAYPAAKRRLIAQGLTKEKAEAMPVAQVLLIDTVREFQRHANNFEKALYVPFQQRGEIINEAERQLNALPGRMQFGSIFAGMMLPAVAQCMQAQERVEWQRRGLQNIEAIRMHLAQTGKLPATLDEIRVVPVPLNPVTHEPFLYRLEGDTAILELPMSDGFSGFAQRFEIQVAK